MIDKENLVEIKKGKTGTGLLIENDGFIKGDSDIIKQINEDIENHHKFICPDNFVVSAVFQKFDVKNANGRVYPEAILKREVEKYIEECVKRGCAIGALDHPAASTLSGHDVTHNILNLEWNGNTLIGEMKLHLSYGFKTMGICSTSGDLVATMLMDDILIGVSSRALGSVNEKMGVLYVEDDLELIGWDVVMTPSTPGAYIKSDRNQLQQFVESKQQNKHTNTLMESKLDEIDKLLF